MDKRSLPYGLWPSPVTPAHMAAGIRLQDVAWDSDGDTLVWLEGRSDRGVLVAQRMGEPATADLTSDLSVRARVGYGGGDFTVDRGMIYFVADGRLYRQAIAGGAPRPITPAFGQAAAPTVSPDGGRIAFVHSYERQDAVALVDAEGETWPRRLISGEDFYMQPTWHPEGDRIAYVCWNHPHMPWDGTWLRVAHLAPDGGLREVETVAGGEAAIFQPLFSPDRRHLAFASDETGWWNLYVRDLQTGDTRQLTHEKQSEAGGLAAWSQGMRAIAFEETGRSIFYLRYNQGRSVVCRVPVSGGEPEPVRGPIQEYTSLAQIAAAPKGRRMAFIASASGVPPRVVTLDDGNPTVHRRSAAEMLPASALARAEPVSWETAGGATVHGLLYRPASLDTTSAGLPPAIVNVHGGPTSQATAAYSAQAQFFATRGYAYLDVNYRGSTGYGRAYRNALREHWGVYDVEDAVSGGRYLADQGLADAGRLVIMGGSAGGYTVLRALTVEPGFFKAGLCLFGVSNLFTLAAETHKFEERYLDSMIGPLPETAARYRERSPIFAADGIVDPLAIFQGEEDNVVPRNQADTIVESLRRRGVPHEYHLYPGEGHGWRKTETVLAFYRSVEAFLRQFVIFA